MEFQAAQHQIAPGSHQDKPVLWLQFEYDTTKIQAMQAISAHWSQSHKCWYLKDTAHNRILCGLPKHAIGKDALACLSPVNRKALIRMQEQLRSGS